LKGDFDTIPRDKLMKVLEMRVSDRSILGLGSSALRSTAI